MKQLLSNVGQQAVFGGRGKRVWEGSTTMAAAFFLEAVPRKGQGNRIQSSLTELKRQMRVQKGKGSIYRVLEKSELLRDSQLLGPAGGSPRLLTKY